MQVEGDPLNSGEGGSAKPAPQNNGGQQENWEERYKGLQREYSKLETQIKTLESKVEAKDTTISTLQQQVNSAEQGKKDVSATYEGDLAKARSEADEARKLAETHAKERDTYKTDAENLKTEKAARKAITDLGHASLIPAYDAGFLVVAGKSGDELKAYLDGYKTMLGANAEDNLRKVLLGSTPGGQTPPAGGTGGSDAIGMSSDQLYKWLNVNPDHPDYDKYEEEYLKLVKENK